MRVLRISNIIRLTGLSRTTIWRLEKKHNFPRRLRLSSNCVGWREDEILKWIESRPRCIPNQPLDTAI